MIFGKVLLDGIDACLEQVKAGFAWHYKKYQHEQSLEDQRLYADAETAREGRLGCGEITILIRLGSIDGSIDEPYQSDAF